MSSATAVRHAIRAPELRSRLGIAVTAALLGAGAALLARRGWPHPAGLAWGPAAVAICLMVAANDAVCGVRWNLFRPRGSRPWDSVRLYAESAMLSTLVPFTGDAWRARGGRQALDGVALDRLVSGAVLGLCALVAAAALTYHAAAVAGVAGPLVAAAAAWVVVRRRLGLERVGWTRLAAAVALSLLYVALAGAAFALAFAAVSLDLTPERAALVTPLVLLAAAVPSVAGLGPGAAVLTWAALQAGGSPAQAASVIGLLLLGQAAVWAVGAVSWAVRPR